MLSWLLAPEGLFPLRSPQDLGRGGAGALLTARTSPQESQDLFCCLYRSWCHNPVTTVSLCFLTQNYQHAYDLIQKLYPSLSLFFGPAAEGQVLPSRPGVGGPDCRSPARACACPQACDIRT